MLCLDSTYPIINGVSFLPDSHDPGHWYFHPLAPHVVTEPDPGTGVAVPKLSLHKFRGDTSGGFLNMDVDCSVAPDVLDDLRTELRQMMDLPALPRLSPVPLVDASVRLMLLDMESGTSAPAGGLRFVKKISHHAHPAGYAGNQAAFSVQLEQAGVVLLEQALHGELSPIGVVYTAEFLALRPAYAVSLSIDWDRLQDRFDEQFGVDSIFFSAQIDEAVDRLVDERVITLTADTFIPEDEEEEAVLARRDRAVAEVRDMLTDAFFEPSLHPTQPEEDGWDKAEHLANSVSRLAVTGGWSSVGAFTYKQTHYTRIDTKTLNASMSERTTVRRRIYPQGHLSGLFRVLQQPGMSMDRFVTAVDLESPWFARRRLRVIPRVDFAREGVVSVQAHLAYADRPPRTLVFEQGSPPAELDWPSTIVGGAMVADVAAGFTVNLAAQPGRDRPVSLVSPPETVTSDVWEVFTRRLYEVVPVTVSALDVPWDRFSQVQVQLRYSDPRGPIAADDTVVLDAATPERRWDMFVAQGAPQTFSHRVTLRATDLRDVDLGWVETDDTTVTVRNPYPQSRRRVVEVLPVVDWDDVRRVWVDLSYVDEPNDVRAEASMTFSSASQDPQSFGVDLGDPAVRTVDYQVTVVRADGRVSRPPASQTLDRRIIVRGDMTGHRIVDLRPENVDFAVRGVKRVTGEIRYTDPNEGVSFTDAFTFEAPGDRATFEFDYVDPRRTAVEYRATTSYANGLTTEGDWTSADGRQPLIVGVGTST